MGTQCDFGWRGLAGITAVFGCVGVLALFACQWQLWTLKAWSHLYFYQGVALFFALLGTVVCAKVFATGVQLCVVFWQIRKYKQLIRSALTDQEQRRCSQNNIRKVLICHASVGAGHKRAAEAIAAAIVRVDPTVDVHVVDLMEKPYADRTLIYFYKDWYLRLVGGETFCGDMGGRCVGFFFDRANSVQNPFTGGGTLQRRLTQSFLLNFLQLVCRLKPDVVVHTHFLAPELLAGLRRRHGLRLPHVTVVTDMDVHAWWYQQPTDHYFCPRELARHQLCSDGVPPSDVTVSGIPIMPQFADTLQAVAHLDSRARRLRLLSQMDTPLDPSLFEDVTVNGSRRPRPLIIQMSTGRSVMGIYRHLLELETPISLVVVCGRQADVRTKLELVSVPSRHRVALLGFTRCMHELMAVGDAIVTKPGGLITSESLACGLMLVIVDPYPGQEERNASMLLEEGAGIWVWDYRDLPVKLDPILQAPPQHRASLQQYQENSRRLARPDAAFTVARYVLSNAALSRMLQDASFSAADSDYDHTDSESGNPDTRSNAARQPFGFLANILQDEDSDEVRQRPLPPRGARLSMQDLERLKAEDCDAVVSPSSEDEDSERPAHTLQLPERGASSVASRGKDGTSCGAMV